MNSYNPYFQVAKLGGQCLHEIWLELRSEKAKTFYKVRAQQDIGIAIWAIATVAIAAYQMGIDARARFSFEEEEVLLLEPGEMLALPSCIKPSSPFSPQEQAIAYKRYIEKILGFSAWWVVANQLTRAQLRTYLEGKGETPPKQAKKQELLEKFTK